MKAKLLLIASGTPAAWSALWTFPSMLASAFLVAWAAEAAQFLISQGLALALLAWVQTLPEFAVEAVIAWQAGGDGAHCFVASPPRGCHSHLAIANFTGAIRLLVGLAWPMIFFVAAFFGRKSRAFLAPIQLENEHAVEVLTTVPPLLYFVWIWHKGSIDIIDAIVLIAIYTVYLVVLWRMPPREDEEMADAPRISRWAATRPGRQRIFAVGGLFAIGAALIYFTAHPFLESMLAIAGTVGVSQFVLVQWVAPFLSEFPEKVSAFQWASRVRTAPMALINMVSSNINQWTVLAAMIPIVYSIARGTPSALPFDGTQREEILLTIVQSAVAVLVLLDMRFHWYDAAMLFVLWLAQFLEAGWRDDITYVYAGWAALLVASWIWRRPAAPGIFWRLVRGKPLAIPG
ncbi:MAG: sodium:calcium antiporter [Gemmatimonadaceae bacterium]